MGEDCIVCLSEPRSEARRREVACQLGGDPHIVFRRIGRQVGQPDVAQQTQRHAAIEAPSGKGDHRDPHPEGFAGRRSPVVRGRVEGDVDLVVRLQEVLKLHRRRIKLHPFFSDPCLNELPMEQPPRRFVGERQRFESQPGIGDGLEHRGPQANRARREFARVVIRPKRDVSPLQGRQGVRFLGETMRVKTPKRPRKPQHLFRIQRLVLRRADPRIADHIINLAHTAAGRIPDVQHLHGRRPPAEQPGSVAGGMPAQVHQHVDPVRKNLRLQRIVGDSALPPVIGVRPQPLSHLVRRGIRRVAERLDLLGAVMLENRLQVERNGMAPQVMREVTDPDAAVRIGRVGPALADRAGDRDARGPLPMLRRHLLGGQLVAVQRGKQIIRHGNRRRRIATMGCGEVLERFGDSGLLEQSESEHQLPVSGGRVPLDRLLGDLDRFADLTEIEQRKGKIVERRRVVRFQFERATQQGDALVGLALKSQQRAEVIECRGAVRLKLERAAKCTGCRVVSPQRLQGDALTIRRVGIVRMSLSPRLEDSQGIGGTAEIEQHFPQPGIRGGKGGIEGQRRAIVLNGSRRLAAPTRRDGELSLLIGGGIAGGGCEWGPLHSRRPAAVLLEPDNGRRRSRRLRGSRRLRIGQSSQPLKEGDGFRCDRFAPLRGSLGRRSD